MTDLCFRKIPLILLLLGAGFESAKAETPTPCSGSELEIAMQSSAQAKALLNKAIEAIENPDEKTLNQLRSWLGVMDSAGAAKVQQVLVNAWTFVDGATYKCSISTDIALGDTYAYVLPDQSFEIVLGAAFWEAPDIGFNSKAGTIIHEMVHFILVGAAEDHVYGVDQALELAARDPKLAQENADNYEYFVEAVAFDNE